MKFWKDGQSAQNRCCSTESEKMARLVAQKIGIPFYVLNVEKEFKKKVVDYFLKEIKEGKTPNPCVVCNKEIKFGLLLEKAMKLNADYVATGHYAINKNGKILKGKDKNKDQSYFLWKLDQKKLAHVMFPVGNYKKLKVRKLAGKFNLPTAETPESQEICFINGSTNDFIKKYLKPKGGNIVDKKGVILGSHEGLQFYTIGQRKGIKLSGGPYFVTGKDFKKNNLIVSNNEKDLFQKELFAKDVNWVSKTKLKFPLKVMAKIRYRSALVSAVVSKMKDSRYKIQFRKFQRAVTPGQSVVFYKGEELLGGGVIDGKQQF